MGSATELGDLVGATLRGRYELRRILGKGGMGAVLSGHDLGLDRTVAVKVILPRLAADESAGMELVARFRREARITAGLRHHHVVDVLDFDEDPPTGLLFLVMEHLEGRDLEKVLARERKVPAERAVRILAQACQAVAHAHRSGQIHRDLKPSNIMLIRRDDEPDFVKVLDFGLARGEDEDTKLTATGQVLGTALYMAPEQIDRRRGRVTRSSDLYALGAVAYHLLSGRPPFLGATYAEIFRGHLYDEPSPLAVLAPDAPPPLAAAVGRALAKRVEERYPSVEAFREALESAVRRRTAPAPAEPAAPPPPRAVPVVEGLRAVQGPTRRRLVLADVRRLLTPRETVLRPGAPCLFPTAGGPAAGYCTERDRAVVRILGGPGEHREPRLLLAGGSRPSLLRIAPSWGDSYLVATVEDDGAGAVLSVLVAAAGKAPSRLVSERSALAGGLGLLAPPPGSAAPPIVFWHTAGPGEPCRSILAALSREEALAPTVVPGLAFPSVIVRGGRILVAGHVPAGNGRSIRIVAGEAGDGEDAAIENVVPGLSRPAFPVLAAGDPGPVGLLLWDGGRILFSTVSPRGRVEDPPAAVGVASPTPRRPALAPVPGGFVSCWTGPSTAPGRRQLLARLVPSGDDDGSDAPLLLAEGDVSDPELLSTGDGVTVAWLESGSLATNPYVARLSLEGA